MEPELALLGLVRTEGILTAFWQRRSYDWIFICLFRRTMISLHSLLRFLVPVLTPSNVVILDNAKGNEDEDAIAMIEATGAGVLFLPPYSPELNPIEHIWSKVKSKIGENRYIND